MNTDKELAAISTQLKQLNKHMDKLVRLLEVALREISLSQQLQAVTKLNFDSKYLLVFGEDTTYEDAQQLKEYLLPILGEEKIAFIGGVELQQIIEIPDEQ